MPKRPINNKNIFILAVLVSIILHGLIYGSCRLLGEWGFSFLGVSERSAAEMVMEVGMIEVNPSHAHNRPPRPPARRPRKAEAEILTDQNTSRIALTEPPREKPAPPSAPPAAAQIPGRAGSAARSQGAGREEYWDQIRRRIEKAMYYPRRARLARLEGTVRVGFTIGAGGEVIRSRIIEPSSHPVFNRAALEIITRAAPFPPPLEEIGNTELSVPITFESTL